MPMYKRILVTTDLLPESPIIVGRASEVATLVQTELHILHVISPAFPHILEIMEGSHYMAQVDMQAEYDQVARVKQGLHLLASDLGIEDPYLHVKHGYIKDVIQSLVYELQLDLVVVGAHSRYGFELFSESTSDKVIHAADCDVLAVRVP